MTGKLKNDSFLWKTAYISPFEVEINDGESNSDIRLGLAAILDALEFFCQNKTSLIPHIYHNWRLIISS